MFRTLVGVAAVVCCLIANESVAQINVTSASRSVAASGSGLAPYSNSTTAGGEYVDGATPSGSTQHATMTANTFQNSEIPDLSGSFMSGSADTSTSADGRGTGGYSALADSFFDVFFNVSQTGVYQLDALVYWEGAVPPWSGHAFVQLLDVTNSTTPFNLQRDFTSQGLVDTETTFQLTSGTSYRLRAEAHVDGSSSLRGLFVAYSAWSFDLRAPELSVPEPVAATLLAVALLAISSGSRRRTRRR